MSPMPQVFRDLEPDLVVVDHIIQETLATDEVRIRSLLDALGKFHGKMLRPALTILIGHCLGEIDALHHNLAAALEMIHTATLIHDDLIDDGSVRRGAATPHLRFGNATAVLLGDFFYTRAFRLVAALDDPWIMRRVTETTNIVCEGELNQMCAVRDLSLSEAEYERIIYAKTAALCETACELGASEGEPNQRAAAAAFGRDCGLAFQIVDDCLDLSGDPQKIGKSLTTDIERGRLTLPVIRLLAEADASERKVLGAQLLAAKQPEQVAAFCQQVLSRGGVASAMASARARIDAALLTLRSLPAGTGRDRLEALAQFIVAREF